MGVILSVCPWEKFSQITDEPFFQPRSNINERTIEEWKN